MKKSLQEIVTEKCTAVYSVDPDWTLVDITDSWRLSLIGNRDKDSHTFKQPLLFVCQDENATRWVYHYREDLLPEIPKQDDNLLILIFSNNKHYSYNLMTSSIVYALYLLGNTVAIRIPRDGRWIKLPTSNDNDSVFACYHEGRITMSSIVEKDSDNKQHKLFEDGKTLTIGTKQSDYRTHEVGWTYKKVYKFGEAEEETIGDMVNVVIESRKVSPLM